MLEDKVLSFCHKHQLFQEGDHIFIAVSGGADSLALLHFFISIRDRYQLTVTALTLDHQLRGEASRQDVQFVEEMCQKWEVECISKSLDVMQYQARHKLGVEEAAREVRYQYFEDELSQKPNPILAMGHHGDDQIETMFMQLTRGVFPKGVPSKRSFANGWIIRPFLCLTKQEIQLYCDDHQLEPRYDETNADEVYTRNAFRKRIIPFIKKYNPSIHQSLQNMSEYMYEDEKFLFYQAEKMVEDCVQTGNKPDDIKVDLNQLKAHPRPLQRRTFHLILSYLYRKKGIDFSSIHVENLLYLLETNKPNLHLDFPGGLKVMKVYDHLVLTFTENEIHTYHKAIYPGESLILPNGIELTVQVEDLMEIPEENTRYEFVCDVSHVTFPLIIRTREKGDKMKVRGLGGRKKIKDIFIDEKIPKQEREIWPIVTDNQGKILWLAGLKKGEVKSSTSNHKWLRITLDYKSFT
ncbi:tRNA(Ile)-lysidine synthase [Salinibacillus kushneri]|uniref:tRNA(Ile)-lysidine synthase n=1 Tax=Salinibacillus kushneri TaxID=237682 RepID=A0A1I0JJG4_9BACI|nr:tRNA lysidine(34) synthetase TilS [Salinibacillus kushneri]SEU10313.1 tRNA(Ile)-lysidine synthase [Salinibacillus kushneri]